jgi:hypothetical protein
MITTIKKLFDKKKPVDEVELALTELGSAVKSPKHESGSAVKESKRKESGVGYFGATGSIGHFGTSGTFGSVGSTGSAGFFKIEDEIKIRPYSFEEPQLSPPGSYPDCPVVMFQTQEWIRRPYLKPIGRSRITGETIYKYTGFNPYEDLDSIDINHYELI